jgi:hypothetical protein
MEVRDPHNGGNHLGLILIEDPDYMAVRGAGQREDVGSGVKPVPRHIHGSAEGNNGSLVLPLVCFGARRNKRVEDTEAKQDREGLSYFGHLFSS